MQRFNMMWHSMPRTQFFNIPVAGMRSVCLKLTKYLFYKTFQFILQFSGLLIYITYYMPEIDHGSVEKAKHIYDMSQIETIQTRPFLLYRNNFTIDTKNLHD